MLLRGNAPKIRRFPLAAATVAALHLAAASPNDIHRGIAVLLPGITSLIAFALVVRTIRGIIRGELRQLIGA